MNASRRQLVTDFTGVVCCSTTLAEKFLTRANWDFERAVQLFFDNPESEPQEVIKNSETVKIWFNRLAGTTGCDLDKANGTINMEGVENLLQSLKLEPTDLIVGYMYYLMDAKSSTELTEKEFERLMNHCQAKDPQQFINNLPNLRKEFSNRDTFKRVYEHVYALQREQAKSLSFDTAVILWELYLKGHFALYDEFMQYLQQIPKNKQKSVNPDTWKMVIEFDDVTKGDLSKYKQTDGWPIFIDEFVLLIKKLRGTDMEVEKQN